MSFFFWSVLFLLALLCPIFVRADCSFSLEKRILCFTLRLFGVKILYGKVFFDKEGICLSLYGRKGRAIVPPKGKGGGGIPFDLTALHFSSISLDVYAGGDLLGATYLLSSLIGVMDAAMRYLESEKLLDRAEIRVIPCYINRQTSANLSIRVFTSIIKFSASFIHTKIGVNHAKRSDRKDHG